MSNGWPKTIEIKYYRSKPEAIMHFACQADTPKGLYWRLGKLNLKAEDVEFLYLNGELQSEKAVKHLIDWLDDIRKEQEGAKGKLQ